MNDESSLARKATAAAISSGSASRPYRRQRRRRVRRKPGCSGFHLRHAETGIVARDGIRQQVELRPLGDTLEREALVTTDEQIRNRIEELVGEEQKLWEAQSRGDASDGDRGRLDQLKLTLDQCWDLLRQRRALEQYGLDPDAAQARPPEVVEGYDQ